MIWRAISARPYVAGPVASADFLQQLREFTGWRLGPGEEDEEEEGEPEVHVHLGARR